MRFGVSTHLYHDRRLEREHLAQIAGCGFETIELFATRSHFDYRDPGAVGRLGEWLAETGLTLTSVHAPITDHVGAGDVWRPTYSTAFSDAALRERSIAETGAALRIAAQIPFDVLVVHLGTPTSRAAAGDNDRAAAARSLTDICALAAPLGVRVAVEVIPNRLSEAETLVTLLDRDLETRDAGICLDFGHAHLLGEVADAVEAAAEHIIATHLHDNRGKEDQHLVPGSGTIDWESALITMQKIGYSGPYVMELANAGSPAAVLESAQKARRRLEGALTYP